MNTTDFILEKIMNAAPDGIIVIGDDGKIKLANQPCQTLFGYSPDELLNQQIEILIPQSLREKHQGLRNDYFATPRTRPMGMGMSLVANCRDGRELPVEISLSPLILNNEKHVIATIRDVTQWRELDRALHEQNVKIKQINAELERSNKDLEQFAYIASHDLQEPLRVISGYTQLLSRRYSQELDQNAKEYIEFAVDAAKRLQNLINDLLAYSRVSSQSKTFQTVDLNEVLRIVKLNLGTVLEESHGTIKSTLLPTIQGDSSQLIQLFQNLVGNALKFRKKNINPIISLEAHAHPEGWLFSIKDNGIGIQKQFAEKIFVIFQRLHTREAYPGTGIGLAICKKIVERHGGKIWLDSSNSHNGAIFYFTLTQKN